MNHYEAQQEAKRQRLEAAADKASRASSSAFQRAHDLTSGIPLGQPILVGHHSEKRHRGVLKRSDAAMRKAVEAEKAAKELQRRADAVGTGGISSDDPDAVAKLTAELDQLTAKRDRMKAVNAAYRKRDLLVLLAFGIDERALERLDAQIAAAYSWEKAPYVGWQLTNLGANCRRIAARIEQLTRKAAELEAITAAGGDPVQVTELNGCTIETDLEANRVTVSWPARLSKEDYRAVRSAGFVWSPTRNGFTRKHGTTARWQAERLAQAVTSGKAVTP